MATSEKVSATINHYELESGIEDEDDEEEGYKYV